MFDAFRMLPIPTSESGGSSTGATGSSPITPLQYSIPEHLMYPVDYPVDDMPRPTGFTPEFGAFSQWINSDMDATPTLAGDHKSLA